MTDLHVKHYVKDVVKRFKDHTALRGVSAEFEKGKIHGIIGRNGSGKTRFLVKPNLMLANTSYIVTDPNGEITLLYF